jgi:hypothetical protein
MLFVTSSFLRSVTGPDLIDLVMHEQPHEPRSSWVLDPMPAPSGLSELEGTRDYIVEFQGVRGKSSSQAAS